MTNLLVGISGSVGVLSMPAYLVKLKALFPNIKVILTQSASHFIPASTLSLIVPEVYSREFPISKDSPSHIELARWADLFIIFPASANVISSAAMGLADTLLTTTILAYEKKVLFFPNMNSSIWNNKILQKNIAYLEESGHTVIPPIQKEVFEVASKKMEWHKALPSLETFLAILQKELEFTND